MYNPCTICPAITTVLKSTVADYWRITPESWKQLLLSQQVNLALALKNYGADVDFATIWKGHTMAEHCKGLC